MNIQSLCYIFKILYIQQDVYNIQNVCYIFKFLYIQTNNTHTIQYTDIDITTALKSKGKGRGRGRPKGSGKKSSKKNQSKKDSKKRQPNKKTKKKIATKGKEKKLLSKKQEQDIRERSKRMANVEEVKTEASIEDTGTRGVSANTDKTKTTDAEDEQTGVLANRPSVLWIAENFVTTAEWNKYFGTLSAVEHRGTVLTYGHLNYLIGLEPAGTTSIQPNRNLFDVFEELMFSQKLTNEEPRQRLILLDTSTLSSTPWNGNELEYIRGVKQEWLKNHADCNPNSSIFIRYYGTSTKFTNTPNVITSFSSSNTNSNSSNTNNNIPQLPAYLRNDRNTFNNQQPQTRLQDTNYSPYSHLNPVRTPVQPNVTLGGTSRTNRSNITQLAPNRQFTTSPPGLQQAAPTSRVSPNVYHNRTFVPPNLRIQEYQTNLINHSQHRPDSQQRAESTEVSPRRSNRKRKRRTSGSTDSGIAQQNQRELPFDSELVKLVSYKRRTDEGLEVVHEVQYDGKQYETEDNFISKVCTIHIMYIQLYEMLL